jgi:hypothetical protein
MIESYLAKPQQGPLQPGETVALIGALNSTAGLTGIKGEGIYCADRRAIEDRSVEGVSTAKQIMRVFRSHAKSAGQPTQQALNTALNQHPGEALDSEVSPHLRRRLRIKYRRRGSLDCI